MKRKDWLMVVILGVITLFTIAMAALDAGAVEMIRISSVDAHEVSGLCGQTGPSAEDSSGARFLCSDGMLVPIEGIGWTRVNWPKHPNHPLSWVFVDYLN